MTGWGPQTLFDMSGLDRVQTLASFDMSGLDWNQNPTLLDIIMPGLRWVQTSHFCWCMFFFLKNPIVHLM